MSHNEDGTVKVMQDWLAEEESTARDSYKLLMDTYAYGIISEADMEAALKTRAKKANIEKLLPVS